MVGGINTRVVSSLLLLASFTAAMPLPRCTVAVAGANGRVGSMVCRELLRNHPQVTVRALVRSAKDPYKGYGRLSYEVGAEDGKMDLRAAWQMDDETGRFASPQTMEFDEDVQAGYGLDRLEIRECELRYNRDVDEALGDVDAVVWCATAFNSRRQRIPDQFDEAARGIDKRGMAVFELRFGKALFGDEPSADGSDEPRREAARGKTADMEGLGLAIKTMSSTRRRRSTLAELTGGALTAGGVTPLVLLSSGAWLGYDRDRWSGELQENEFGYFKRQAEAALKEGGLPHAIVRSAAIDDLRGEEGLEVQTLDAEAEAKARIAAAEAAGDGMESAEGTVGAGDDEAKKRRIHPRDLASYLVSCLEPSGSDRVVDAWTYLE